MNTTEPQKGFPPFQHSNGKGFRNFRESGHVSNCVWGVADTGCLGSPRTAPWAPDVAVELPPEHVDDNTSINDQS